MHFLKLLLMVLIFDSYLWASQASKTLNQRFKDLCTLKFAGMKKFQQQDGYEIIVSKNGFSGEEYVLVPKRLVGPKLERYFSGKSCAVIAMSCCNGVQVHRKCLQKMYHADKNNCSRHCPGCEKFVTKEIFAQSRPCYIKPIDRKSFCSSCRESLK